MSALLAPRPRPRDQAALREPAGQATLFAAADTPTAQPALPQAAAHTPTAHPTVRPAQPATLDDVVAGAWEALRAGAPAGCLVCGTPLSPRHSAGAGVVGGRCGGCGSTLG
jgi:hypothetical protein